MSNQISQNGNKGQEYVLLRESQHQSSANKAFLTQMVQYWNESPGSIPAKLQNFPKYVSREDITKFLARNEIFLKQLNIHGSIIDLGVARGASLMTWLHLSSIYEPVNYTREIVGFDTFAGIVKVHHNDTCTEDSSENLKIGGFAVERGMLEDIKQAVNIHSLTRYLSHISKVHIVPGEIEKTLPEFLDQNPHLVVSLLNLDTDVYSATHTALNLLIPRMPKGAIILFDELNSKLFPGETIALEHAVGIASLRIQRLTYAPALSYAIVE